MSACRPLAGAACIVALFRVSVALAVDDGSSLFVQPHTGAFLRLEEKERRAVGRFAKLDATGLRLDLMLSAPLDSETRESSLARLSGAASGLSVRLAVGYDSRKRSLSLTAFERNIQQHYAGCVATSGLKAANDGCSADERAIVDWYERTRHAAKRPLDCELTAAADATADAVKAARELEADCEAAEVFLETGVAACHPDQNICAGMQGLVQTLEAGAENHEALGRHAVPSAGADGSAFYHALVLEGAYSLDRVEFYLPTDIAQPSLTRSSYAAELGARLDLYVAPDWAFSLRAGVEWSRGIATRSAERCQTIGSTDSTVRGESCRSVRVLSGDIQGETAGYARASAMYLLRNALKDSVPGVEARIGFESLGQKSELDLRLTTFISPVTGPVLTRFGIGVDFFLPLESDGAGNDAWALRDISPFLVIGASL